MTDEEIDAAVDESLKGAMSYYEGCKWHSTPQYAWEEEPHKHAMTPGRMRTLVYATVSIVVSRLSQTAGFLDKTRAIAEAFGRLTVTEGGREYRGLEGLVQFDKDLRERGV